MKRVLLIGGAGFIGHHLALALRDDGHEVMVMDSLGVNSFQRHASTGGSERYLGFLEERLHLMSRAGVGIDIADAREFHEVARVVRKFKPDALVHLAAVAHADRSQKDPWTTFDHSLRTLENALDNARANVGHFIFFSSSMAYGDFSGGVAGENHPLCPTNFYGELKWFGERLTRMYEKTFALPCTIIRPSALYGERCVSGRVIQKFIESALKGEPVTVKGNGALDFTYIQDLVNGVVRVLAVDAARGETFNLTFGRARAVSEVAESVKKEFPKLEVRYEPKDEAMPERGTLLVEKARKVLGYEPRFPLEEGIKRYIAWYRSRREHRKVA